jgi:hypothetical protein
MPKEAEAAYNTAWAPEVRGWLCVVPNGNNKYLLHTMGAYVRRSMNRVRERSTALTSSLLPQPPRIIYSEKLGTFIKD